MDITEIRFKRLAEAETLAGGLRSLAERADLNEKYLRQIRDGFQGKKDRNPRRLGDDAARRIEKALGLPRGWMDSLSSVDTAQPSPGAPISMTEALSSIRNLASPRSQMTIDRLVAADRAGELADEDWALIDAIVARIRKR